MLGDTGTSVGTRVLFENEKIRVWDLIVEPGQATPWHQHRHDYLYIVLETGRVFTEYRDGSREYQDDPLLAVGFHQIDPEHRLVNVGERTYRNIIVELLDTGS